MAIDLILEVLDYAPEDLTPQERLAAVVFAEDARIWGPGNRLDRKIYTPLDDEKYQRRIGVSSERKVKELAQSLARKGVLESVQRGQKGKAAEYRISRLAPASAPVEAQHPGFRPADVSTPDTGVLNDFSAPESSVQHPGNRGAYSRPPKTPLPADVPGAADAASSAARRAGETHTPNTPTDPTGGQGDPSPGAPSGEKGGSDEAASINSAPVVGSQDAAAQVLARVDFGRMLRRDERERLTARLGVLVAGGWTADALTRELGDLRGAVSPVAVFTKRARELPDAAPTAPAQSRALTAAEAIAASESAAAADSGGELTEAERDAGRAWREQRAAQRAQSAAQAGSGVLSPGAGAKRREGALSVGAGPARFARSIPGTSTRCRSPRSCPDPAARP
ncbi:MAG TPA: hypothetical protein VL551_28100 [Actinospica sp.]|jgi:hypothetical protein|nr:hypothetical protein [Actinospica sp.]